jgi:hypothetical protein
MHADTRGKKRLEERVRRGKSRNCGRQPQMDTDEHGYADGNDRNDLKGG